LKHVRKPLSKGLVEDTKAADAEKGLKMNEDEKEKEPEKEHVVKEKSNDNRDWKRNGACWRFHSWAEVHTMTFTERRALARLA
jgi:hypothetical protein